MSLIPSGFAKNSASGYQIDYSLTFNDDSQSYLYRTPSSAGNRKTWTWSGWSKRSTVGNSIEPMFDARNGNTLMRITWNGDDVQVSRETIGVGYAWQMRSNAEYRDTSGWYHVVVVFDTTQSTASNRVKIYINGEQVTSFSSSSYPSQNTDWEINATYQHDIGLNYNHYYDGYLAEINFIDGQALDPTYFGETGDYGEWKPIEYTGTYGTNGFYLDFSSAGPGTTGCGKDFSGNGNNFSSGSLSTQDQKLDTPTNNFATFNRLHSHTAVTLAEGNLQTIRSGNWQRPAISTMGMITGKWYWEATWVSGGAWYDTPEMGLIPDSYDVGTDTGANGNDTVRQDSDAIGIAGSAVTVGGSNQTNSLPYVTQGDIIQMAYDADTGKIYYGINNQWYKSDSATTNAPDNGGLPVYTFSSWVNSGKYILPTVGSQQSAIHRVNFGQDSSFAGNKTAQGNTDSNGYGDFYYTPPSGFLALCTANLSDPAVIPSENFNTVTYVGNGSTNSITGVGFGPDLVWMKHRTQGFRHELYDKVRGVQKPLMTNLQDAEGSVTNGLSSFDSDGWTMGDRGQINYSGQNHVAWCWKANGSGSSNTNGSITTTASANQDAGFSIISYTGNGTNGATIGHGLTEAPECVIIKARNYATNWWVVGHKYTTTNNGFSDNTWLYLNKDYSSQVFSDVFNSTAPTSSVITLGTTGNANANGRNYVAYAFHSVDGFSKFGRYTGNGSLDGPFVYTGFKPKYVMIKETGTDNWLVFDGVRDSYNEIGKVLYPNLSNSEDDYDTSSDIDFVSNGFKTREDSGAQNQDGQTYIYLAFAENPFKHTNAR